MASSLKGIAAPTRSPSLCSYQSVPASPDALGPLTPPPRFANARFGTYQASSPSQRKAFQAARAFTERVSARPSLSERLRTWGRRLFFEPTNRAPQGLYLVGPAGTGKTHLMAAAFRHLDPEVPCAFLHSGQLFRTAAHPEQLADRLATTGRTGEALGALMLDEVELDDAANEARLAHFLRALSEHGVALMATSNARPNEFLSRHVTGGGAHQRFLNDALTGHCEVVLVRGTDRRRQDGASRQGTIFVGPSPGARAALRETYDSTEASRRWMSFSELRRASTETAHHHLLDELSEVDQLYVADVDLEHTDDALRLLRLVDDLYTADDAPALYFSASAPPRDWFAPDDDRGLRAGIAEKFSRTVSRLHELCTVREVETASAQQPH